ncbi:MAG: hypothetical protein ACOC1P_04230 [Minisyncoccales bacterium]
MKDYSESRYEKGISEGISKVIEIQTESGEYLVYEGERLVRLKPEDICEDLDKG